MIAIDAMQPARAVVGIDDEEIIRGIIQGTPQGLSDYSLWPKHELEHMAQEVRDALLKVTGLQDSSNKILGDLEIIGMRYRQDASNDSEIFKNLSAILGSFATRRDAPKDPVFTRLLTPSPTPLSIDERIAFSRTISVANVDASILMGPETYSDEDLHNAAVFSSLLLENTRALLPPIRIANRNNSASAFQLSILGAQARVDAVRATLINAMTWRLPIYQAPTAFSGMDASTLAGLFSGGRASASSLMDAAVSYAFAATDGGYVPSPASYNRLFALLQSIRGAIDLKRQNDAELTSMLHALRLLAETPAAARSVGMANAVATST